VIKIARARKRMAPLSEVIDLAAVWILPRGSALHKTTGPRLPTRLVLQCNEFYTS
jgi:hypothetical protein